MTTPQNPTPAASGLDACNRDCDCVGECKAGVELKKPAMPAVTDAMVAAALLSLWPNPHDQHLRQGPWFDGMRKALQAALAAQPAPVYTCDFCSNDYTDAKYCCQRRRDYLNAHGLHETAQPAPGVGGVSREWLESKLTKADDGHCAATMSRPSCLLCGQVGDAFVFKADDPDTYCCKACASARFQTPLVDAVVDVVKRHQAALATRPAESVAQGGEVSAVTAELIQQIRDRDSKGRAKYGVTLDRADLTHNDWLQHMAEELMDAAGYALAAKRTTPATGSGGEACEVCRIFGDSSLLRKSAAPVNSIDEEMVTRALDTLAPQAVTNRYGYRKGYRVRDVLALDDYEATEVMRAAITAALTHPAPAGGDAGDSDWERQWREGWAFAYSGSALYGDDGELQDNRVQPFIDWRKDSPGAIRSKIAQRSKAQAITAKPGAEGV